jgi:hypothetical protein
MRSDRSNQPYRNHFVTGAGCTDHPEWNTMVEAGHAKVRRNVLAMGGDDLFWLTLQGAKAALNDGEMLNPEDFPEVA